MGTAIITIKLMPESPDVDLSKIQDQASEMISAFTEHQAPKNFEIQPVAFGLKSLSITFAMREEKGSPDDLETQLTEIEGVQSAQITEVRRALG